eukprot:763612-Hanusia_phi.AAC.15
MKGSGGDFVGEPEVSAEDEQALANSWQVDPEKFDREMRLDALPAETKARLEELRALQEELLASAGIAAEVQTILVNSRGETKRKAGEASTTVSYCGSSGSESGGGWSQQKLNRKPLGDLRLHRRTRRASSGGRGACHDGIVPSRTGRRLP